MTFKKSSTLALLTVWRPYPLREWLCIVALSLSALLWGGSTAYTFWIRAEATLVTQKSSVSEPLPITVESLKDVAAQMESRGTEDRLPRAGDLRDPRLEARKK